MLRKVLIAMAIISVLLLGIVGVAAAADPHSGGTGQPNQSCENPATSTRPGNASNAPGSAFADGGVAGTKYAGEQTQNQKNPKSVSQYDVACFQQSSNH